jgi:L-rhamnose mutarotase
MGVRGVTLAAAVMLGVMLGFAWSDLRQSYRSGASAAGESCFAESPASGPKKVQRIGSAIGVKPEKLDEYVRLHANTWPGVLDMLRRCNIHNYSIYLAKLDDGKLCLFSYFEYTGNDLAADSKRMADDPTTQEWWKHTNPCQIPLKERKPGEHWMTLHEVFHTD